MKVAIERRRKDIASTKEFLVSKSEIHGGAKILHSHLNQVKTLLDARTFYAAARVQGIIRGFLARFHYKELILRRDASITLQSLVRGRLGRVRWVTEFWLQKSVVKSLPALDAILERSKLLREGGSEYRNDPKHWEEYWDPLTDSFWYFNPRLKLNTWDVPPCFQHELVCCWNGFQAYGGLPSQKECRKVFHSVSDYRLHMNTAHRWHCPSCGTTNKGLSFPTCVMCENTLSPDGEDAVNMLKEHVQSLHERIQVYMKDDKADENVLYSLKKSMVKKVVTMRKENFEKSQALEQVRQHMSKLNVKTKSQMKREEDEAMASALANIDKKGEQYVAGHRVKLSALPWEDMSDMDVTDTPAPVKGGFQVSSHIVSLLDPSNDPNFQSNNNNDRSLPATPNTPSNNLATDIRVKDSVIVDDKRVFVDRRRRVGLNVNQDKADSTAFRRNLEISIPRPGEYDPVMEGEIPLNDFMTLTEMKEDHVEIDSDSEDGTVNTAQQSILAGLIAATGRPKGETRLNICDRFIRGQCDSTTCSAAHPGLRDSCETQFCRVPGRLAKVPYVLVCENATQGWINCPNGKNCKNYHIYVRPSTMEICRRMYPMRRGHKTTLLDSGARIDGNVYDGLFNGYGTMTWENGDVYVGDWKNDLREGWGVFTSHTGIQYVGEWIASQREGFGVCTHPNGEEYVGEWHRGRMHGVGRLKSRNDDVYEGTFVEHKYCGIGTFSRARGDRYMGYFKDNMAWGLGVLALSSGEKYKGFWYKNARHGKGVCSYPNKAKYAGEWFLNHHEGFGIFVSSDGERYVGNWKASKKDGMGRYYFNGGDVYDGEWCKNHARGMGTYCHANGNIYRGQWMDSKRNGFGTYNYNNGSRYTGYWKDNDIHGKGKMDYASGSYYRGEYQHNNKHGRGIFIWPNGNTYKGNFANNVLSGQGTMKYILGHEYTGEWAMSKKHGYGVFTYSEGHVYKGDWFEDGQSGHGVMTYFPGTVVEESYDGEWQKGVKHGKGIYRYRADEGTIYEGEFHNGQRVGFGKLSYEDGSYYRGDFKEEQMWGKGVYVGADGSQYDGDWVSNMRHGKGSAMTPDGFIYTGEFWKNMKQGEGKEIRPDGVVFKGTWDCGIMVGQGEATLTVGDGPQGGPTQVKVQVFSF